jgi:MFS family permease
MLLVGRVIGGVASGIVFGVCPMFMSEISPPEFRGAVGGLYNLNINLGYTREYSTLRHDIISISTDIDHSD